MAEVKANVKVPEFLREPLEAAQARLEAFEEEAQKALKELVQRGRERRKELSGLVSRMSADGTLRGRIDRLRVQGMEELRGRAESFRTEALERLEELQAKAVAFLGAATREQVVELSKELDRLSRRLDRDEKKPALKAKPAKRRKAAEA